MSRSHGAHNPAKPRKVTVSAGYVTQITRPGFARCTTTGGMSLPQAAHVAAATDVSDGPHEPAVQ